MLHVILFEPEIPPNTGNIMRLCANTGCRLHLIRPLGFRLNDRQLERAGMDYRANVDYLLHDDWQACRAALHGARFFAMTTKGRARYDRVAFQVGDAIVFGPETRGLPLNVLDGFDSEHRLRIPMREGSRSINLSNAVSILVYEAWRQQNFPDAQ